MNDLCRRLGIEFPIFAFTHCRDVVAAVTNAGGMGVLGAVGFSPGARGRAGLARRARGRPPLRRRHRHSRQVRGHGRAGPGEARGRAQGHGPRGPPHVHQDPAGRARRPRAPRGAPPRAAGLDGRHGRPPGRGHPHAPQGQAGGQRSRHPARRRHRARPHHRPPRRRPGRVGQARPQPQERRGRHRDLPGQRGWRPHRRRRQHRAVARGHRRRRPTPVLAAGASAAGGRWRRPWSWVRPGCGPARSG